MRPAVAVVAAPRLVAGGGAGPDAEKPMTAKLIEAGVEAPDSAQRPAGERGSAASLSGKKGGPAFFPKAMTGG
jgi:hypothetical protein